VVDTIGHNCHTRRHVAMQTLSAQWGMWTPWAALSLLRTPGCRRSLVQRSTGPSRLAGTAVSGRW
jgi:hypothetical protein